MALAGWQICQIREYLLDLERPNKPATRSLGDNFGFLYRGAVSFLTFSSIKTFLLI
jgi:hypothetical protein